MRVTYSGLIAYWIDGQGCSWLGPVECAPWRRERPVTAITFPHPTGSPV